MQHVDNSCWFTQQGTSFIDMCHRPVSRWGTSGGKCKKVGFNNSDLTSGPDPAFPQSMPASWSVSTRGMSSANLF